MNAPNPSESTAIAVAARQQFDLSPQTFEQALTFSQYLADSEMVPKQYRGKPGDCLIAMQWGMEIGLKPLQALQSIAAINGKPNLYGDAGKALLLSHGCIIEEDDISIVQRNERARCKITRPGRPPVERTFSVENAKTANIWNKEGPWRSYPWRQMAWRAFWFAARDAAADLLRGMGGFEEAIDYSAQANTGTAAAALGAPATYPQESFDKNLPAWRKAIEAGKKTAEDVIATVETKAPLTEEQKGKLRAITPASGGNAPEDVKPKTTFAHVAERINKAENRDQLDEAALLIGEVGDEQQRRELTASYETRLAEMKG